MGGLYGEGRYRHPLTPGMRWQQRQVWLCGRLCGGRLGLSWVPLPLVGPLGGSSFLELEKRPLHQPSQQMQHP